MIQMSLLQTRKRVTDLKCEFMVVRGREGILIESLGRSYTHCYIQNGYHQQGPIYSTGNSARWYMAAWTGGGLGRMDTYTCMAESLHCSSETITTLLIGYTPIKIKSLKFEKKDVF